jgi:iron complex outermembrane receptor protein
MKLFNPRRPPLLAIALLSASSMPPGTVSAQDAEHPSIAEVIVTAQKRPENVLEVPIAISALSGDVIGQLGAADFKDFARMSAGVSFRSVGPNQNKVVIRGVSSVGGAAATTGYYLDETPLSTQTSNIDISTFDLDRVEVLRGPQGTLYGASSMGGTVRFITTRPKTDRFEARVLASVGTIQSGGDNYEAAGMVNVPLIDDRMALRVSGSKRHEGGWIDKQAPVLDYDPFDSSQYAADPSSRRARNINDLDVDAMRATLRFDVTDDLHFTAAAYWQETATGGQFNFDNPPGNFRDQLQARLLDEGLDDESTLYNALVEYDLAGYSLVSSTSVMERDIQRVEDTSRLSFVFLSALDLGGGYLLPQLLSDLGLPSLHLFPTPYSFDSRARTFTQELRVSTPADRRLRATFGVYYESNRSTVTSRNTAQGFSDIWIPLFQGEEELALRGTVRSQPEQRAAFGELNFDLAPRWTLTTGLRYFESTDDTTFEVDGTLFNGFSSEQVASAEHGLNPKAALAYTPDDDTLLYVSATKGFRAGGANRAIPVSLCADQLAELGLAQAPRQFQSDSLWTYEVGAKASMFDRRVAAAAAVYRTKWSDLQQSITLLGGACDFSFADNVGEATIDGAELELTALLSDRLTVRATGSYNDARISAAAPNTPAEVGDMLQDAPRWTFALLSDYRRPLSARFDLVANAGYQYSSSVSGSFDVDSPDYRREGYGLLNVRLGIEAAGWSVIAGVTNVLDKDAELAFPDSAAANLPGYTRVVPVRPRTFALTFEQRF